MSDVSNLIDHYLEQISLVHKGEAEGSLGNTWRNVANTIINTAMAAGKVNKSRCLRACVENLRCKQDCDLRSTTLVIRGLQSGITRCRGDQRCVKAVAVRIVNIARRGDQKIRQYGFGVPYLSGAMDFVNKLGLEAKPGET